LVKFIPHAERFEKPLLRKGDDSILLLLLCLSCMMVIPQTVCAFLFLKNSQKFQVLKRTKKNLFLAKIHKNSKSLKKEKKELNFKKIQVPKKRKKEMHTPLQPTCENLHISPEC